jgi:4-hydroxythreonine-4-phosphate dehydrogenase
MTGTGPRRLIVTSGDPAGIGPEVVLRALPAVAGGKGPSLSLTGPELLWETAADRLGLPAPAGLGIEVLPPTDPARFDEALISRVLFAGRPEEDSAALALSALEAAVEQAMASPSDTGVVTGPVHKGSLHGIGFTEPGQTEWFARCCGGEPLMLLVGGGLRVALITTHLPLREVAAELSLELTRARIGILHHDLRHRFGVAEPRIALLALNPHGGTEAEEGEEESRILRPAIASAREEGIEVAGPFSADAFFGWRNWQDYDAVLAPYHDQGLIPVKAEAGGAGVNVTLGLPIVRTSPDHGTAFAIAGAGNADPRATINAIRLGAALLEGRGATCRPGRE